MNVDDSKLNDDWIKNFEKTDKLYQDFYKSDLYYVNLKFLYINRENEIVKIRQEPFLMSKPNYISREEILQILLKYSFVDNFRYSLLSILLYNFTLEPADIKNYLTYKNDTKTKDNYIKVIKNIDAITFEKTINMFHYLNDLILIFYEKQKYEKKQQTDNTNTNNSTKKVYLYSNTHKKTIRKQYKD